MDPSAPSPEEPEASTTERGRILGLETEHAVLYVPDDSSGPPGERGDVPPFELLQLVLFESLLAGRKAAVSGGLKGGYFLENGGLVHLEIFFRQQSDTPILEACTPECRSPRDLLHYSRAYDEILEETSRRTAEALLAQGYRGRIAFGKNNLDVRGTGFGCHENYLLYSQTTRLQKVLFILCLPVLLLCMVPALIFFVLIVASTLILYPLGLAAVRVVPAARRIAFRAWEWLVTRNPGRILEWARAFYWVLSNAILFPAILCYSVLLRFLALRRVLEDLSSFLACRQILTGTGCLNFKEGVYELSQRAELTTSLGKIILFGKRKTFFDLKGFLYSPLEFFRSRKKLTITVGDSNLADVPNLLKLGMTTLILEMIEAGESFADLRLRRPVRALKQVSREGPWKELRLRSGKTITAIALAREFLRRARKHHQRLPSGKLGRQEILTLWEDTLDRLAERPHSLADTLDWAAKKSLLDRAILSESHWKAFFAWGSLFELAGLDATLRARSFNELVGRAPLLKRLRTRMRAARAGIDPSELRKYQDLYFQARKIDFRYHELGGGTGYHRILESDGHLKRLTKDADVAVATREPPQDTRARIRGYYIRQSKALHSVRVNWNEIELRRPARHIPTPDPFYFRLPTD